MSARLLRRITLQILHQQRPRPHQAHLPLQHIPQLRQLIQRCGPQKTAQSGQPSGIRKKVALAVPGIGHGAEFIHGKRLAVPHRPNLPTLGTMATSLPSGLRASIPFLMPGAKAYNVALLLPIL